MLDKVHTLVVVTTMDTERPEEAEPEMVEHGPDTWPAGGWVSEIVWLRGLAMAKLTVLEVAWKKLMDAAAKA